MRAENFSFYVKLLFTIGAIVKKIVHAHRFVLKCANIINVISKTYKVTLHQML